MGEDRASPYTRAAICRKRRALISRGKPFVALTLLLAGWTGMRVASIGAEQPQEHIATTAEKPKPQSASDIVSPLVSTHLLFVPAAYAVLRRSGKRSSDLVIAANRVALSRSPDKPTTSPIASPSAIVAETWAGTPIAPPPLLVQNESTHRSKPLSASSARTRFSLYAYSYWRWPSGITTLAPGGQYGGSQSGLIATYGIWTMARIDAQVRIAFTAERNGEREAALGLRWQPVKSLPLHLVAERRFRNNAPDRFAASLAGGINPLRLPAGIRLEGYGQAGWVTGPQASWFFDASAQVTRRVFENRKATLSLGVGAWAGGQRGAQRLDIGPRLDLQLSPKIPLRLSADWRFRMSGNARPDNGPAVTLSTAF